MRLRHLRAHPRTGDHRQLERYADLPVVALEGTKVVFVVIEFSEEAILRHQIDARHAGGRFAATLQLFGHDLRLQPSQILIRFQSGLDGLRFGKRQRRRLALLLDRANAVVRRHA